MRRLLPLALFFAVAIHAQDRFEIGAPTAFRATSGINFSPSGPYTGPSTTVCIFTGAACGDIASGATIFYTTDGSTCDEASILYSGPITVSSSETINACLVQTSGATASVIVQNGQYQRSHQKTVLACTKPGSSNPSSSYCPSNYQSDSSPWFTPDATACSSATGNNCGVAGIPLGVNYSIGFTLPTIDGAGTTAEWDFTTGGNPNVGGPSTQVLVPYNYPSGTTGGSDKATAMNQNFYLWPEYTSDTTVGTVPPNTPANMQNYELDLNQWNYGLLATTAYAYGGASMRASPEHQEWDYNGQSGSWKPFCSVALVSGACPSSGNKIVEDSTPPFGKLNGAVGTATCSTSPISITKGTTAYGSTVSGVKPGEYLFIDQGTSSAEEVFITSTSSSTTINGCVRGFHSTAVSHANGARWVADVHVQFHTTLAANITGLSGCGAGVGTVFIDYLIVNNRYYGTPAFTKYVSAATTVEPNPTTGAMTWWPLVTTGSAAGYSSLYVCYSNSSIFNIDRIFDQKQWYVGGAQSTSGAKVGGFIQWDNVSGTYGMLNWGSWTGTITP
jgi:hypothetical protein